MTDTDAQWLVRQGYQGHLRRVYLIRLVDDAVPEHQASTDQSKAVFRQNRLHQWQANGILPTSVFKGLVLDWIRRRFLSSTLKISLDEEAPPARESDGEFPPAASFQVDVGLTFEGMAQLKLNTQLLDLFRKKAPAFSQGAFERAAGKLGDCGQSDPARWQDRYKGRNLHAVLVVHAAAAAVDAGSKAFEIDIVNRLIKPEPSSSSISSSYVLLSSAWIEQSVILRTRREIHFGMMDGISSPEFRDAAEIKNNQCPASGQPYPNRFNTHCWGELLLGHERNDGSNTWCVPGAFPTASARRKPSLMAERVAYGEFFKNGSFGAVRKMGQDVDGFEKNLKDNTARLRGNWPPDLAKAWFKAKMLGRWENGHVITPQHEIPENFIVRPDSDECKRLTPVYAQGDLDNFGFGKDMEGFGCPYGAHIRRMNPRDDRVAPFVRRPLVRRGVPYGNADAAEKGLLGLFFCASLEEQFEHVLGNWADNSPMGLPVSPLIKDPIIGNQVPGNGSFEIPRPGREPMTLLGMSAYVRTLGTSYAFFPSVSSLVKIATGDGLCLPVESCRAK